MSSSCRKQNAGQQTPAAESRPLIRGEAPCGTATIARLTDGRTSFSSCRAVSPRAVSQNHAHPSVSTFRRARWTIRSGDFVHRLSGHFGGLGASQHPNGDAGGCEIGEGHWASARRRGAGGASRRPIRRGYNDRHWSLTRRASHFDDQARTADQRASTGAHDAAP
jgi:hypothetical protein